MPQTREPGYDVATPVYAAHSAKKWGTMRLGFSLRRASAQIQHTRRALLGLSLGAILGGTALAIVLAMRISRPIGQLVARVHEFAGGLYDRPLHVYTRDEIGYLAEAFEKMRISRQLADTALRASEMRIRQLNVELEQRVIERTVQLEAANQELEALRWGRRRTTAKRCITCVTTVLVLTWPMPTDSLRRFSVYTRWTSLKAPALAWPPCSASCTAMVVTPGRRAL